MLPPHVRANLRAVIRDLEDPVLDLIQEGMLNVHNSIKPGTTTLDQITHNKGRADGMAELWQILTDWAQEPGKSDVPAELDG